MTSEHLLNLQRIGQLDAVPFSAELMERMLAAADSRLQDARRSDNSLETRFDCRVLDGLRKQRNLSDYDGETITHAALQECLAQAQALLAIATETLK